MTSTRIGRLAVGAAALALLASGCHYVTRASVSSAGTQGNGDTVAVASQQSMSSDGRYVVFNSRATNLAPGAVVGSINVYVRDNSSGTTTWVAVGGISAISGNGQFVVYGGADNQLWERNLVTSTTKLVSANLSGLPSNGISADPAVSSDGSFVSFVSTSTDLIASPALPPGDEAFLRDVAHATTRLVSGPAGGGSPDGVAYATAITPNGSRVAFLSRATNLVAGLPPLGPGAPATDNVYVWDAKTDAPTRVSTPIGGGWPDGSSSGYVSISDDGKCVAFETAATNLVAGDTNARTDAFVGLTTTGAASRVSVATDGAQAVGGDSHLPTISGDCRVAAFSSTAANLVPADGNAAADVFTHDLVTGLTARVSTTTDDAEGNGASQYAGISGNGDYVAYSSVATNLVTGDTNGFADLFVTYAHTPIVGAVTPAAIVRGASQPIAVSGSNFRPGATVELILTTGITVSAVTVVDEHTITATLTATASAGVGSFMVTVKNPGGAIAPSSGGTGTCSGCLHVT